MSDIYNPGIIRLTSNNGTIIFVPSDGEGGVVDLSTAGGGGGTVTEIFTGLGLTGGPITTTGTISIANQTAFSLAGYGTGGVFENITIGTGLNINGAGVLSSFDNPGGSNTELQYNNSGTFGGATAYWDNTNNWLGINITPEATLDVLNIQAYNSGANTAARFQATGVLGNFAVTVADPANHYGIAVTTPDYFVGIGDEGAGNALTITSGGTILSGNDTNGNSMVFGGGSGLAQLENSSGQTVFLGFPGFACGYFVDPTGNQATLADGTEAANFSDGTTTFSAYLCRYNQFAGWFLDSSANQVYLANGSEAIQAYGPIVISDVNTLATNFQVQTGGFVATSFNILDDGSGNAAFGGNINIANVGYIWPTSNSAGVLTDDGAGNLSWGPAGSGTPGGSQYDIQVNDGSGGFYGDSGFTYDYATGAVSTAHTTLDDGSGNLTAFTLSATNHLYAGGISVESGGLTMVNGSSNNAINLAHGRAGAGGAPLYFTSASAALLTTPADGAMEYDGTHLYIDIGSTRYQLDRQPFSGLSGLISADVTGQTATNSSVVTVTSPNDGNNHQYQVGAYINVTAISAGTVTVTYTFTDEASNSRTLTLFPMGLTAAGVTATGFIAFPTSTIRVKPNTAITMVTTFTGVSVSYDTGGNILRIN